MTAPSQATERQRPWATLEERRAMVANLLRRGYRQSEIARALQVGQNTISKDVQHLKDVWRKQATDWADIAMHIDIERIDLALKAIYDQVINGDLQAIDRWDRLLASRREIFGYAAPKRMQLEAVIKKDVNVRVMHEFAKLTPEECAAIVGLNSPEDVIKALTEKTGIDFEKVPVFVGDEVRIGKLGRPPKREEEVEEAEYEVEDGDIEAIPDDPLD